MKRRPPQRQAHRGPTLRLLVDLGATHQRLLAALSTLPEPALSDESVIEKIGGDTLIHSAEHRANLEARLLAQGLP